MKFDDNPSEEHSFKRSLQKVILSLKVLQVAFYYSHFKSNTSMWYVKRLICILRKTSSSKRRSDLLINKLQDLER